MASSLEELLAKEGFKGIRRVERTRSSFHGGALTEPRRLSLSTEGVTRIRTKSESSSFQGQSRRPRDKPFLREKIIHQRLNYEAAQKPCDNTNEISNNAERGKEIPAMTNNNSSRTSFEDSNNKKNQDHYIHSASNLALDQVAVQAVVSILNGYMKRFLRDEDFRATLRHNCFSSLNFIELKEENNTETKIITSLEQAIETIEQTAEQSAPSTHLKRATMQLSIITGLSLNDLKHGCTCGIPNYKLSACAHLYLSVVYVIQRKSKVSAKHLLQVFCDSPYQARSILLPELWEQLFSPQLTHLKAWYDKEAEILATTTNRTRKTKLLQQVYNEHLDSATHIFAVYYKDWLTEGVESPAIPSISVPSISVAASSFGHSSDSASSNEPFSPQPMISKKLYDSVFGSSSKTKVYDAQDNIEMCVSGSYSSTIVKQTLTYESETTKFTDQDIEDFALGLPIEALHQKGTQVTAAEELKERGISNNIDKPFSTQTYLDSHIVDALSFGKEDELTLIRPNKMRSALAALCSPSTPDEFICPLTGTVFEEPVTLETGQTFQREAIKAWFEKGNRTCPVTGNTLEFVAMPLTNLILKRVIDKWKSESLDHLLNLASQTVGNSKEFNSRNDEVAVFKLESFLSSFNDEEKRTYAKYLISIGVLSFLFRRFELGNLEEKSRVVALLLICIVSESRCIYRIAENINRKCLLELLHSKEVTPLTNAILLLTELSSMKRRKDVTSFISDLVGEDVFKTLRILLKYLNKSTSQEKSLTAVLLLHFDLLVEPQKFSIYREVAVNVITAALDASLNDEKARAECCRALLVLCGHFSSNGRILTKTRTFEEADCNINTSEVRLQGHEEEGLLWDHAATLSEDEEAMVEELLMKLLESLVGNGESPFLTNLCRCLDSRHLDLVRECLVTVKWLSSSLSKLMNVGFHLPAFLALISQLKGILENGELELKTLASVSLLNFSKISECRTLLKTMAEDIAPLLHRLVDVTWTAKQLHAIVSGGNL
ncbi:putative E3 ubiquitin-protein ligase LIN [Arachis duranensis]|uniref:RING-type E3 ubiquitin transferase n=1 Tax=Arachis duranensis TaxID=130453 RepID=A0A6P4D865_ARADU|nr:putative E3 ubiquitin-protein ligase LIN [Arachis duranensis]